MVDLAQPHLGPRRRRRQQSRAGAETGKERPHVRRALDEGVLGVAVEGDGGPRHLACVVLLRPGGIDADGPAGEGGVVGGSGRGHPDGQIPNAVAMRPHVVGDRRRRSEGAASRRSGWRPAPRRTTPGRCCRSPARRNRRSRIRTRRPANRRRPGRCPPTTPGGPTPRSTGAGVRSRCSSRRVMASYVARFMLSSDRSPIVRPKTPVPRRASRSAPARNVPRRTLATPWPARARRRCARHAGLRPCRARSKTSG